MTVSIGTAALTIVLQPGATARDLARVRSLIDSIDQQKMRQEQELEELNQRTKENVSSFKQSVDGMKGVMGLNNVQRPGLMSKAQQLLGTVMTPIEVGATALEYTLPRLGQAIQSGAEGTVFDAIARDVNRQIQQLAAKISDLRADLEAIQPTAVKMVQFNVAALRLGGKIPEDQDELAKQTWKIEQAQRAMERSLKRDIDNQTIDMIIQATKRAVGGGR